LTGVPSAMVSINVVQHLCKLLQLTNDQVLPQYEKGQKQYFTIMSYYVAVTWSKQQEKFS